ncbi:hypothetical protein CMV_003508 [Castanea mollissima]|uniref:Uncharacterized protein n=2 Tax=Castanea mollissima TaxID=60419 RepID=A0A8J4RGY3_9ROSI|nr:hypothetical protein CMV_003508 [Castanea mollissima]
MGLRRRRVRMRSCLIVCAFCIGMGLLMLSLRTVDSPPNPTDVDFPVKLEVEEESSGPVSGGEAEEEEDEVVVVGKRGGKSETERSCATVEEMGKAFHGGFRNESLRVRRIIQDHFALYGASRVRSLPPEQFCRHGFVMGKSSEAGFGNEMYKVLTGAALSIMLNRSLIIGQTRKKYPFGDYISYSNHTFTLKEVKHLWRHNGCERKYKRHLIMRTDDFEKPSETNVLCSNWQKWKHPIIWLQGTTDATAAQFFLKNIHPEMRNAASNLFGQPESLQSRANVFGELMKVLISPTKDVEEAVNWVIGGGVDPDISLHMRMLMNRSVRAVRAALNCVRKAIRIRNLMSRPKVVLVSDSPSLVKSIKPDLSEFAEVLHFDFKLFKGNISSGDNGLHNSDFRVKDWGPAPRWVAFVDFFLASRAKYAVVSGAHRRVGTTYAQLIAGLAAAYSLEENSTGPVFSFLSSFQSNLLEEGLRLQVGWGHVWNRFAGPLSCRHQPSQCAFTPLLPPAWWEGLWQSPIPRDIRRLAAYGVQLSGFGTVDEDYLQSFCKSRKTVVKTVPFIL